MTLKNTQGKIFYGLHFYPGVAEYQEPGGEPYRVFLNEDTLRKMDPSFAGKPIFVEHVDAVDSNLDELRKEADGWVIESFFNTADGKHWTKFIIVSERAEQAIKEGMRLSNAYIPKSFAQGGLWNGVTYAKEITDGEYEHLAIVTHPRYEESEILTPEQFKQYNEKHIQELKRLANSKGAEMKLNFFKKAKVENALDPDLSVILPKSGKEKTITQLVNEADEKEVDKNAGLADMSHKVKMQDGSYCNVGQLLEKHKAMQDELESMKKDASQKELDVKVEGADVDSESSLPEGEKGKKEDSLEDPEEVVHDEGKDPAQVEKAEDKEAEAAKKKDSKKNEIDKTEAKAKAERLKNAHLKAQVNSTEEEETIELMSDKAARGKALYGSQK